MGAFGFAGGFGSAATRAAGQAGQQRLENMLALAQLRQQLQDDPLRRALLLKQLNAPSKISGFQEYEANPAEFTKYEQAAHPFKPDKGTASKTQLTGDSAAIAHSLSFPTDTALMTPPQLRQYLQAKARYDLSRQKAPQPYPPTFEMTTDASGKPIGFDVTRPRGGGAPSASAPIPLPGLPRGKTTTPKAPGGFPTGYTRIPSTSVPGAYYLSPNPGTKDPATGYFGVGASDAKPMLFVPALGRYFKPGEAIGPGMVWDGKP